MTDQQGSRGAEESQQQEAGGWGGQVGAARAAAALDKEVLGTPAPHDGQSSDPCTSKALQTPGRPMHTTFSV